jgi:hypothetical protein
MLRFAGLTDLKLGAMIFSTKASHTDDLFSIHMRSLTSHNKHFRRSVCTLKSKMPAAGPAAIGLTNCIWESALWHKSSPWILACYTYMCFKHIEKSVSCIALTLPYRCTYIFIKARSTYYAAAGECSHKAKETEGTQSSKWLLQTYFIFQPRQMHNGDTMAEDGDKIDLAVCTLHIESPSPAHIELKGWGKLTIFYFSKLWKISFEIWASNWATTTLMKFYFNLELCK